MSPINYNLWICDDVQVSRLSKLFFCSLLNLGFLQRRMGGAETNSFAVTKPVKTRRVMASHAMQPRHGWWQRSFTSLFGTPHFRLEPLFRIAGVIVALSRGFVFLRGLKSGWICQPYNDARRSLSGAVFPAFPFTCTIVSREFTPPLITRVCKHATGEPATLTLHMDNTAGMHSF